MIKNISNLGDAALYCDFGDEVNKEINSDVIKYFKSGIDENTRMLKDIANKAKNALPKEENVHISGV